MTDTQLYLAIGIPSALFMLNSLWVISSVFWQSKRFDDLKDLIRSEIVGLRSDLARIEGVLNAKMDGLTVRVKALDEIHSPLVNR